MSRQEESALEGVDLRLLKAAVAASGQVILINSAETDAPGPLIAHANPALTRMTGYAAHEVVGRSPRLPQGPETDRAALGRMRAAVAAGEPFRGEAVNYRKDGSTLPDSRGAPKATGSQGASVVA